MLSVALLAYLVSQVSAGAETTYSGSSSIEVWQKSERLDTMPARSLLLTDVKGVQQPAAGPVKLRGRPFVPGGDSTLLPHVVPDPTPMFPLLVRAQTDDSASLDAYAEEVVELVKSRLHEVGAVLIRGLPLEDVAAFEKLLIGWYQPYEYTLGTTTRTLGTSPLGYVNTASELAPAMTIEPHQEQAYLPGNVHPAFLTFFCGEAAQMYDGGQTLLTDMRKVTASLDASYLAGLKQLGLTYFRVFHNETGASSDVWPKENGNAKTSGPPRPSWQKLVGATRAEAEEWMESRGYEWEWLPGDTLRMWQTVPNVTKKHPITGEDIFFAQPHAHHRSYHSAHPTFMATDPYASEIMQLPVHCTYGNGEALSEHALEHVRSTFYQHSVAVEMQKGDVLVVDNIAVAHGRMGIKPSSSRKMYVALGGALSGAGCDNSCASAAQQ